MKVAIAKSKGTNYTAVALLSYVISPILEYEKKVVTAPSPLQLALRLVAVQFLIMLVVSLVIFIGVGTSALSYLLGSIVVIVPTVWFALRFFHAWRQRSPKGIMVSLFMAEAVKLVFCTILVVIFLKYFPVNVRWFILGLVSAYLAFWLAVPLVIKTGTSS
tara:strand:+ start:1741 stop:2223 length:483 start_codon:yes stop_codon:yes gene_type:complete